jgi:peptide deformylase
MDNLLRLRHYPDAALLLGSVEVTSITGDIIALADKMIEVMYENNGVGLAANQVGVNKRLFVYDPDGEGPEVVLNPYISARFGESTEREGCLSVEGHVWEVKRYAEIVYEGVDLAGRRVAGELSGILARIFQHEIDHLNGKIIIDRITRAERSVFLSL